MFQGRGGGGGSGSSGSGRGRGDGGSGSSGSGRGRGGGGSGSSGSGRGRGGGGSGSSGSGRGGGGGAAGSGQGRGNNNNSSSGSGRGGSAAPSPRRASDDDERKVRGAQLIVERPLVARGSGNEILDIVTRMTAGLPEQALRTLGRTGITIGVTDRDGGGVQNQLDAMLVRFGTRCRVIVLRDLSDVTQVHGVFLPGGMADLPNTLNAAGQLLADPRADRNPQRWTARVQLQYQIIAFAIAHNIPILGVCGGSRCLAQGVVGGSTRYLTADDRSIHNQHFGAPWDVAHEILITAGSKLRRIVGGGHYLRGPSPSTTTTIAVNSMHWAQSAFTAQSPVHRSASSGGVLEGWELMGHPFFVGVQWHPEFAQLPVNHFAQRTQPHVHVMNALGEAAHELEAARTLQAAIRCWAIRRCFRRWLDVVDALRHVARTPGVRRGELDNPRTLAIMFALDAVVSLLEITWELRTFDGIDTFVTLAHQTLTELQRLAWRDDSISTDDAEAIDRQISDITGVRTSGSAVQRL